MESVWVYIQDRIVNSVNIFVYCKWFIVYSLKHIPRQEPSRLRVIVPALQVVPPRLLVIPVPRVTIWVLYRSRFLQQPTQGVVLVGGHHVPRRVGQRQHISAVVGLVVVRLPAPGHADGFVVRAVGVTVDDLVALIRLVHHVVVLVIMERDRPRRRRHRLPHAVGPVGEGGDGAAAAVLDRNQPVLRIIDVGPV